MAQGNGLRRTQQTLDTQTQIADDTAAVTASGAAKVGGSAKILDLGGGDQPNAPIVWGDLQWDISAVDVTTGDEQYDLILEGSNSSTFASGIDELVRIHIGGTTGAVGGRDVVATTGRYVVAFSNEKNGTTYQYVRGYFVLAGTTPSVTSTAHLLLRV